MLYTFTTPGLSANTYLVFDPETKKAAVIDPVRDVDEIVHTVREKHLQVIAILETHVHADFVSGSKELRHRLWGLPVIYCSGLGGEEWLPAYTDIAVKDREEIDLGSIKLQAWHTPGHTSEHLLWLEFDAKNKVPKRAYTGDFLFVNSVGRPDLLGENSLKKLSDQLYHSVFEILPQLPDELEIYPSHGAGSLCGKGIGAEASSTLGLERKNNPFLKAKDKEKWISELMNMMPPSPKYFSKMKRINVSGPGLISEMIIARESTPEQFLKLNPEAWLIVDVRDKKEFAKGHFKGSLNIGLGPIFANWAPIVIPDDRKIILIAEDEQQRRQAIKELHNVGIDRIELFFDTKRAQPAFNSTFPMITSEKLKDKIKEIELIDVRGDAEWQAGHVEGAKHIMLKELLEKASQIPKGKAIAVICGSGYRASIGASLLLREGYKEVCNVEGGMQGWTKAGFPITK